MQILVEKIAKLKQINPDMPRNLAKTVTVWIRERLITFHLF
jgi:glucosamine 6-phosphate synthetase-like amidotransferase/phosphosugar isomerase protein